MTSPPADYSDVRKRIKHLENENIKYRKLLKAIDLSNDEAPGVSELKDEAECLRQTMKQLEEEKLELENELNSVLEINSETETETADMESLKAENELLKQILAKLEAEKLKLTGKI